MMRLNIAVQWLALLLSVWNVMGSNLEIDYLHTSFLCFPQALQAMLGLCLKLRLNPY
jgi:hypothetical protein